MRALVLVVALAGCQSVAGLGDPVGLAEIDSGIDTGTAEEVAVDADSEPVPTTTSTPLFLYRESTGDVAFVELASDGRITSIGATHIAAHLTHFAALEGNKLLSYDAATGVRTISGVDPKHGSFATITQDTSPGFSAFAAHDKGRVLLSYRKEGTLRVDRVVGTSIGKLGEVSGDEYAGFDTLVSTREGPFLLYDSIKSRSYIGTWRVGASLDLAMPNDIVGGLAPIATILTTHVFFFARPSGLSVFTQLSDKGTDLDLASWNDGPKNPLPSVRADWSHIVGAPKTLLFYRASDGKLLTATLVSDEDFSIRFFELTPTPPPTIGTGWTHIVSLE
jgi:hypothetical protein